jgi:hypothetical protein
VTAAIIAEALAFATESTTALVRNHKRTTWLSGDVEGMVVLDPVRYHRDDVMDAALRHLAERVERAEESAASLRDALAAVFEIAAGCDGAEFESVFSIAHDALAACKGCFPEGGPSRPLVPTVAVEQAEARTKSAKAEAWALREALRKVQICCQYTGTQQILMVACDVKAIVNSALASKGEG